LRISVKVQPKSSREEVIINADGSFKVYVKAPPTDNKANFAVIKVLAGYFNIHKSGIKIMSGQTGSKKIIEIDI
jgi:uncharacterized protein